MAQRMHLCPQARRCRRSHGHPPSKSKNSQPLSVGQVSRDLNLTDSAVRRWVAKYDAEQRGEPVNGLPLSAEQRRIRELERENQQLKQDVALLKKASAFFAQEIR